MVTGTAFFLTLAAGCSASGWAVVTGASSGIGRAIAREAAANGYSVVAAARSQTALQTLGKEITSEFGVRYELVSCDLSTAACRASLRRATREREVSLLVANAGVASVGNFVEAMSSPGTRAAWASQAEAKAQSLLDLNLGSTVALCRLYGSEFAAKGRGRILITGSITALAPLPGASIYGASKAFLRSFAEGIRQELAPSHVSVTLLSPGGTDSGFAAVEQLEESLAFTLIE